MYIAGDQISVD